MESGPTSVATCSSACNVGPEMQGALAKQIPAHSLAWFLGVTLTKRVHLSTGLKGTTPKPCRNS